MESHWDIKRDKSSIGRFLRFPFASSAKTFSYHQFRQDLLDLFRDLKLYVGCLQHFEPRLFGPILKLGLIRSIVKKPASFVRSVNKSILK